MESYVEIGNGEWNATLDNIEWDLNDYDEQMPTQILVKFTEEEYYEKQL